MASIFVQAKQEHRESMKEFSEEENLLNVVILIRQVLISLWLYALVRIGRLSMEEYGGVFSQASDIIWESIPLVGHLDHDQLTKCSSSDTIGLNESLVVCSGTYWPTINVSLLQRSFEGYVSQMTIMSIFHQVYFQICSKGIQFGEGSSIRAETKTFISCQLQLI